MTRHLENCNWQCTPEAHFGTDSEIHVWKIPLLDSGNISLDILSGDEQNRLSQIKNASSRSVFISSRIVMRKLFSDYLGISPAEVTIKLQPEGKPFLQHSPAWFEFNLSHSGEQILLAVANHTAVGLDIEAIRPVKNWQQIARKVFPQALLGKLAGSSVPAVDFIPMWTEFEARQKLSGSGVFGSQQNKSNDSEIITFKPNKDYLAALAFYADTTYPKISFYEYAMQ